MAIEMLLNDDNQHFFFSNDYKLSKENKCNYVHYSKNLKSKLDSFHLNKISIKYEYSKFMFL
jgi:hypothetical protein